VRIPKILEKRMNIQATEYISFEEKLRQLHERERERYLRLEESVRKNHRHLPELPLQVRPKVAKVEGTLLKWNKEPGTKCTCCKASRRKDGTERTSRPTATTRGKLYPTQLKAVKPRKPWQNFNCEALTKHSSHTSKVKPCR
jgi:hypothetical protein